MFLRKKNKKIIDVRHKCKIKRKGATHKCLKIQITNLGPSPIAPETMGLSFSTRKKNLTRHSIYHEICLLKIEICYYFSL
jgi:hypothetical protein